MAEAVVAMPSDVTALIEDMVTEDDEPWENLFSEKQQRLLTEPLYSSWTPPVLQPPPPTPRSFLAAATVGPFAALSQPPLVPAMFLSLDISYTLRYERQGGSEDSALTIQHYYDATDGRVRFIFIHGGATNGSQIEHRIYFDAVGKRLWEDQRYTAGPGYPFPVTWPEDDLQKINPQAAFDAASPCQSASRSTTSTSARKGPPQVVVPDSSDLWLGRYTFGEDGGKTAGGSIIYVANILTVARHDGKLVATLESNGYQTSRHAICQAVVTGNRLEILFQHNNPEEPSLFEEFAKDDRLFTLERLKRGKRWVILTHWDKFTGSVRAWPSGRVYFAKESGIAKTPLRSSHPCSSLEPAMDTVIAQPCAE